MRIFTSRYQNGDEIIRRQLVPIGITVGRPRFRLKFELVGNFPALAPVRAWFGNPDFANLYRAKLDRVGVPTIRAGLAELGGGDDVCLLCFEAVFVAGGASCHRRTFAAWWQQHTGEVIAEIPDAAPVPGRRQT